MNSEAVASQEATPTFEFERLTANSARVIFIGAQFANDSESRRAPAVTAPLSKLCQPKATKTALLLATTTALTTKVTCWLPVKFSLKMIRQPSILLAASPHRAPRLHTI